MNSVMRRCSAVLLIWVILVGNSITVNANHHEETNVEKIYEVITRSNLRNAPSLEGGWIATIPGGDFVTLLGDENAEYCFVSYQGLEGYIYSGCIKKAEEESVPAENAVEAETEAEAQIPAEIADNTIEPTIPSTVLEYSQPSQSGAGTSADLIAANHRPTAQQSTQENIQENTTETVSVETQEPTIPSTVLEYSNPQTYEPTLGGYSTGSVLANAVMREVPSAEGGKILTIGSGSLVTYLDEGENGYIHISYQGQEGYVYGRCVELEDGTSAGANGIESTVVAAQPNGTMGGGTLIMAASGGGSSASTIQSSGGGGGGINPSALSQRQENAAAAAIAPPASSTASNATSVQTTTATQAVASQQSVAQAQTLIASAVTAEATQQVSVAPADASSVSYQIAARANMRRDPSQSSEKLTTLPVGADVVLLGQTSGGYTMVQYDGMVGYVLEDCVTDVVDLSKIGEQPVLFTITGYCPCSICCGNYSPEVTGREARTATGTVPQQGRTIAVDPSVIPYGTQVNIEGLGVFVAEDCGGMIQSNHIDVYFDRHEDAVNFGTRRLYVTFVQ